MKLLNIQEIYENYDKGNKEGYFAIGNMLYEQYKQGSSYIDQMAVVWDQIVNFYEGKQHLVYNKTIKSYQPRPVTKFNRHIPRPVTNYTYPIANAIVSLLTRNRPRFMVTENSDQSEDINRAKLTDALLDAKYEIDKEQELHDWAMKCATLLGSVYRKDIWDTSGLQTVSYKNKKEDEAEYSTEEEIEKTYKEGEPKEEIEKEEKKDDKKEDELEVPLGDNKVLMLSPLQMLPDYENAILDIDDGFFIGDCTVQQISQVKLLYDKKGKGYTGLLEDIQPEKDLSLRMDYLERMKGSSSGGGAYNERPDMPNSTVLIEMYIKPDAKHPKGLMLVSAGNVLVYAYECKYTYGDCLNWHPYSHFKYDINPFKHHGITCLEQIVQLNDRVNKIDALQILNRKTMASPQWLVPHNSMMPEQYPTGAPGEIIPFKESPNGAKPEKTRGYPLDNSVHQERQRIVEEMHIISGVNEILTGNQPTGVGTATALQILLEQTNNKFNPVLQRLSKFIERGQTKKANLIRRFYKEPRKDLINRIKAMNKNNLEVEIDDLFTGKMLGDNIDVRVEGESMMPRSRIVEQNLLTQLIGSNLYGDLSPQANPKGNAEILAKFNAPKIANSFNKDIKRAEWENDLMRQHKFDMVQVLPTDDPIMHYQCVKDEIDRPEFYQANDKEVINIFWKHLLEHFIRIPEQAYGLLRISPKQVDEFKKAAIAMKIEDVMPNPTLEDRVIQLEQLAQQMTSAPAGIPSGAVTPVEPAMGIGGGTPDMVNSPVMA